MGEIMDIAVHFPLFFYLSFHLLIFLPVRPVTVVSHHQDAADSTRSIRQKAADSPDNGRQLIVSPLCLGLHCLVHLVYQRCEETQCMKRAHPQHQIGQTT